MHTPSDLGRKVIQNVNQVLFMNDIEQVSEKQFMAIVQILDMTFSLKDLVLQDMTAWLSDAINKG